MAETGTAANFLLCDDDVKRDFFAMAVSDSTRRKQAEEALALLTKPAPDIAADGWRDIVWMLETPATDNSPTRWWNPDTGWMIDPAKGIRFCRQEDAEAFKRSARSMLPCRATEHVFLNIPQPDGADRP